MALSSNHACAIAAGEAYCWGYNNEGQLGNTAAGGSTNVPVKVTQSAGVLAGKTVTSIAANYSSSCVIADGRQYCWGNNTYGQLGTRDTVAKTTAVQSFGGALAPDTITFDGQTSKVGQSTTSTIDVTVPAHSVGTVDVVMYSKYFATRTLTGAYEYRDAPSITSILPGSGGTAGGDIVTITGARFDPGALVSFRNIAATSVTFINASTLQAVTPANLVGHHDVSVVNEDGQVATMPRAFYAQMPAPSLVKVTPSGGPPAGGNNVTIDGQGIEGNLPVEAVTIGDYHKCSLADGEVYCVGTNTYGQLGDGTTTNRTVPTKVAAGSPLTGKTVTDRKSTRLNSSHRLTSRMPSSA
jgi:alpha-tubulin suppressor-like RCC1 family protein